MFGRRGAGPLAALALACVLAAPAAAQAPADRSPPGANDWSCKPSSAHPNPVVLVHGFGANMAANWFELSPFLDARGYCVVRAQPCRPRLD